MYIYIHIHIHTHTYIYIQYLMLKPALLLLLLFTLVFDRLLGVYSEVIFTVIKCRSEAFSKFHWRLPDSRVFCVHAG